MSPFFFTGEISPKRKILQLCFKMKSRITIETVGIIRIIRACVRWSRGKPNSGNTHIQGYVGLVYVVSYHLIIMGGLS
jgi:hypothetical protein